MLDFNVPSFIIVLVFMLSLDICHADSNVNSGWQCSEADNSTSEKSFMINLGNLLNILTENGPLRNGFFKTTVGRRSGKIYGLVQCRGDVSAENCANCTRESVAVALHNCSKSKKVQVWFTWCFLRYSNEHFFGVWDQSSMARVNDTNFDDVSVVSKGLIFMREVAITAPKQPLMFHTAVLDAGQFGKRYGMAQCTRDIIRTDCSKCLDTQLVTFRTTIGNKRGWEVYGSSCSMWYHDYQFFSNISIPTNDGARRVSLQGVAIGISMAVPLFLILP
ncbi:cysteine-rich repeat secretory protein 55-like [Durio zibethinus]|uniref:Cysteine-rich repeat secretory protein 55-like n=1 Tax=Durio zibethinus TaxID=66656 RepID=A0A6P5X9N9_DURZI|nr:cysteine-rich repeat secretory protein 55-like [Durio zibethinus]